MICVFSSCVDRQDNEWRRVIGFLTGVVDSKLSRVEMEDFANSLEVKLRCISRRLSSMQFKMDGDTGEAAAGTKKARCLSCDRIVRAQRIEYVQLSIVIWSEICCYVIFGVPSVFCRKSEHPDSLGAHKPKKKKTNIFA